MIIQSIGILLALAAAGQTSGAGDTPVQPAEYSLKTSPERVYFTVANSKEGLAGSIFFLVVETTRREPLVAQHLELQYRKGSEIVRSETIGKPLLELVEIDYLPPKPGNPETLRPRAYRMHVSLPEKLVADSIHAEFRFSAAGAPRSISTGIPVQRYVTKTKLVFPFKGEGIISAAGALNAGHRNRSGLYAVDALGLSELYAAMTTTAGHGPNTFAGWGREIIAPAAGTVVIARGDRPDQPVAGNSDPAYYLPQYPDGGDPGNHVVIDHGNGEFSMIAHMQHKSVRVKVGDVVQQGQVLGLLGNSGDSGGPHVHYQMQSGPDWERSDALPFVFSNVSSLVRGSFFDAG